MNILFQKDTKEYYNGLSASVKVADEVIEWGREISQDPRSLDETKNFMGLYVFYFLTFVKGISFISRKQAAFDISGFIKHPEIYDKYPRLTFEEFYDVLCMLPSYVTRKVVEELECDAATFDDILYYIKEVQKDKAIEVFRDKCKDIKNLTKLCGYLAELEQSEQLQTLLFSTEDEETAADVFDFYDEKVISYRSYSESLTNHDPLLCWIDFWEKVNKHESDDVVLALNAFNRDYDKLEDCFLEVVFDYWDNQNDYTIREKAILDEILCYDKEIYEDYRKRYESRRNVPTLKLPSGLFEAELDRVYQRLNHYCQSGQGFTSFFGYGDRQAEHLIWNGDWNTLSYFLRVLYVGILKNGDIDVSKQMERGVWNTAVKIFRDENGNPPELSTLKNFSIEKAKGKDFVRSINDIFISVFANIKSRNF